MRAGNCAHRRYLPELLELVRAGQVLPSEWITQTGPIPSAIGAYRSLAAYRPGWVKMTLEPQQAA